MAVSTRMRIGELAEHIGTSPRSLRHYEQQGLLSPVREANGYRVYDELNIVRAANVKGLLDVGLTTEDVLHHLKRGCLDRPLDSMPRCVEELETVQHRMANLDDLITRLQQTRHKLAEHHSTVESEVGAR